ncbi:MAG: diacylglycerol kinase family protein [Flavobacteriaceae bacterium]|nr:diacylglycerol kinase family protein [Flavobacteriaceae bacterium]
MITQNDNFILGRMKGAKYALKGAIILLRTEASIQVQFIIASILTIAGFYYEISATEWMLQVFSIGLIMSIEGLNTAVEEIADFIHPEFHNKIGLIKDLAAGAVLIAAITATIVGFIIYVPKIIAA